jgi:hypothetical protein
MAGGSRPNRVQQAQNGINSGHEARTPTAPHWSVARFLGKTEKVVSLTFASWNQVAGWLRRIDELQRAA